MTVLRTAAFALVAWLAATLPATADDPPVFEVDTFNAGLGPAPASLDRSTPRATIESLQELARREAYDRAAHLLNLDAIGADAQPGLGPELARQLHTVISRKAVIDWARLPDRPDGLAERANQNDAMGGAPRRSILLWTLELDGAPAAIRLNRVKAPGADAPVWVFSGQTVENLPALFERYGPSRLEKAMPDALRQESLFGLMAWELLGFPVLILLAGLAGWIAKRALDAASNRVRHKVLSDVLRAVRGPAIFGIVTGLAWLMSRNFLVFSGQIDSILTPLVWIGILGSSLWLVVNAIDVILDRLTKFGDSDLSGREQAQNRSIATRVAAVRRMVMILAVVIGAGLFLSSTNVFQNFGLTLLGTAGAVTLILGFAARRVLGNILASLQIALNQSARIGDRIVFRDQLCHVERIHFTFVQLRDWDGTRLIVPVEEFVSTPFENWTLQEPEMLRVIKLKLAHQADVEPLRRAFDEVVQALDPDELGDLDQVKVRVTGQDVLGIDVWFYLPCADPNTSWDMACQAREMILERAARLAQKHGAPIFPEATPAEAA